MNRPLLTVFTWKGDDERIERHWPYWQKANCDILLSFPVDAPCVRGGLAFGESCHHGAQLILRIFRTFEHVLRMDYHTFYFIEADSIILGEVPRTLGIGLHAYLLPNIDKQFVAPEYPHYAHGMSWPTLGRLHERFEKYHAGDEKGYPDRLIGRICHENKIRMLHRPDLMYSRNLLDQSEYVEDARQAVKDGALFIHGLKQQSNLDALLL